MMKMKNNQWGGGALVIFGLIALVVAYSINLSEGVEIEEVRSVASPLSHSGEGGRMAGRITENQASGKVAGYLYASKILMVGGIVSLIAGGAIFLLHKGD